VVAEFLLAVLLCAVIVGTAWAAVAIERHLL
jgi:hypothetical protein